MLMLMKDAEFNMTSVSVILSLLK